MRKPQFPQIRVTEHASELLSDLEQSYCTLAAVNPLTDPIGTADAYAALCQRRKDIYEYLEWLEKEQELPRTVILRFT